MLFALIEQVRELHVLVELGGPIEPRREQRHLVRERDLGLGVGLDGADGLGHVVEIAALEAVDHASDQGLASGQDVIDNLEVAVE
eukprot:4732993-Pyramimonas_sp.AAC.1